MIRVRSKRLSKALRSLQMVAQAVALEEETTRRHRLMITVRPCLSQWLEVDTAKKRSLVKLLESLISRMLLHLRS